MYKVYRKYKKNGFQNTLKMAKMCSLRGTVRPRPIIQYPYALGVLVLYPCSPNFQVLELTTIVQLSIMESLGIMVRRKLQIR